MRGRNRGDYKKIKKNFKRKVTDIKITERAGENIEKKEKKRC